MNVVFKFNFKNIRGYYIFFALLQFFYITIKCENCENCDDPSSCNKCRYHEEDDKYYLCPNTENFYMINNGTCEDRSENGCTNKVIYETKECVGHCPTGTYELGDYCYKSCDESLNLNLIDNDQIIKSCVCKNKYIIHKENEIGNRERYECLAENIECKEKNPNYFYDLDTKQCVLNCNKKIFEEEGKEKICSSECESNKYSFSNKCYEKCPEQAKYYYTLIGGKKNCINKCDEGDIYVKRGENGIECVSQCDEGSIIVYDIYTYINENKLKQCINQSPINTLFLYNNVYFKNCSDTLELFNKKTFNYKIDDESNGSLCVDECSKTDKPYLNFDNECTENCGDDYYYAKTCVKECETSDHKHDYKMNFIIINNNIDIIDSIFESEDNTYKKLKIDKKNFPSEKECLEKCPTGTYTDKDGKNCYISSCPDNKLISSNFECIDINNCEGYIVNEEVVLEINENVGNEEIIKKYKINKKYCFASCPNTAPYYYKNGNECYNTNCSERFNYSAYDNPYICYDSCQDIEGSYNYSKDYICYKAKTTCDSYFFVDENNVIKCANYHQCIENGYAYIRGKECVKDCEENEYKIKADKRDDGVIQNTGECFSDINGCINEGYPYFNTTNKICLKECDGYKISNNEAIKDKEGNCFSICPQNYPKTDIENKLCLTKCPFYFYNNTCYDNGCEEGKFHFRDEYECLDSCQRDANDKNIYFYDDATNTCYYSCSEVPGKPFAQKEEKNSPLKCVVECQEDSFYYVDKKECLNECDILTIGDSNICVSQCPTDKKKVFEKACYEECPSRGESSPELFISKEYLNETFHLIVDKCVEECNKEVYPLVSNSTNYCLKECPLDESYEYNGKCYKECPKDTFVDHINKKCWNDSCHSGFEYYEKIGDYNICKMACPFNKFTILNQDEKQKQCLEKCPEGYNYIGGNNTCLQKCSDQPSIGQYFIEIDGSNGYPIYKCSQSCGDNYTVFNTKECSNKCPEDYYESPNQICYLHNCTNDADYPFTTVDKDGKKICAKKCHESQPNYGDDKICKVGCGDNEIIDFDGKCVSSCQNSYYKFLDKINEKLTCVSQCQQGKKYLKDYTCVDICPSPNNYVEGNECRTECDSNHFQQIGTNEIECVEKCNPEQFYYNTGSIYNQKICKPKCDDKDFVIEDTQICTKSCLNPYYSYFIDNSGDNNDVSKCVLKCPKEKPYHDNDLRTCVKQCPVSGNKFHIEGEVNCRYSCPEGTKIYNNTCISICSNDKFLDYNGVNCIDRCVGNYLYYIEGVNQCLRECPVKDGYFIEDYKCVTSCGESKPYLHGNYCKENCEDFIEVYANNRCVKSCPEDHPFYREENGKKYCMRECELSLPSGLCVSQCDSTYNHINYENHTCLTECPDFYVKNNNDNVTCYKICPSDYPYYNLSSKECTQKCDNGFINITSNECIEKCDLKIFEETEKSYCLKDCNDLGLFSLGDNKCVRDCSTNNMIPNMATKSCECENLYYINNGEKTCTAECTESYGKRLFGSNQCLGNCDGYISSLDGKYCYSSEKYCPENTKNIDNKCDCEFNYYYVDETSQKVCLSKDEKCPLSYNLFTPETKECDKQCNEDYKEIGNLCLKGCSEGDNKWYLDDENNYICTNECKDGFPYEIEEEKRCVKKCEDTEYYITQKGKCISTCDSIPNTILKKTSKILEDGSTEIIYECSCTTDLWYEDSSGKIQCNVDSTKKTCSELDISKTFLIKDTKECVATCEGIYSYSFNSECYHKCEDVKNYYNFDTIPSSDESKECNCRNLWKMVDNKKECIESEVCNEDGIKLLVYNTRECTDSCRDGTFEFNNTCYTECPPNTKRIPEEGAQTGCQCKNKWYKYNDLILKVDNIIICFDEEVDCPRDFYPYLDYDTKECIDNLEEKCADKKIFNNTCYSTCPSNTTEKGSSCECDITIGVWHQNTKDGKRYFYCGLSECPQDKNYLDYDTKECRFSCDKDKYHFEGACYTQCPDNTKLVDELSKECTEIISFGEPSDLATLNSNLDEKIKNIYEKTSTVGLVYNLQNSTMQIYGVNKKQTPKKDLIMRSNLTYIDLSKCIDKLYSSNGLEDDNDIVIVKYDIGDATDSQTINPVEFKLFDSKNGNSINMDACKDNSILISYPLSSILNSYPSESKLLRNLEENVNNLNLREKFLKGKELYLSDNEIDSFNFENKIYTDMCYPFKLNGKDLILEDRLNYLYPSKSFCESNCIYNSTDFVLERVNCYCSPKDGLNFDRAFSSQASNADIQKVKNSQKGSLLKCLFKVSHISNNLGFFYGLIMILIEVGLILLTLLYSYKIYNNRIQRKFNIRDDEVYDIDNDNIENGEMKEDVKYKNKKNNEIIKTTERNLDEDDKKNPPKRNNKTNLYNRNKKNDNKKAAEDKKANNNKKDFLTIEKLKVFENGENEEKIHSPNSPKDSYEQSEKTSVYSEDDESIIELIEREEKLLRVEYNIALTKNNSEIVITILTEILDKIYLIKSIWLLQRYDIFSINFSLYLLWHMLLLSFLSLFYTNNTIHKIWIKEGYPNLSYYLAFGLVSSIIIFVIYKGLSLLIDNNRKINEIESIPKENAKEIRQKFKKMMFWSKIKLIIFYVIEFVLLIIFFLYLISFCGVFSGTQSKLIESYGIALIEIVIIKIFYGLILGVLRKMSLSYEIDKLYNIVRFLDLYIS